VDPIAEYQKWKQQGEALRAEAKQAMEGRFRELLTEAAQIALEYQRDFGAALKPPPPVTAFRYKAAGSAKAKPNARSAKPTTSARPAPPVNPKVAALEKRRAQVQKKIDAAKAAGKPTKNLEDQLYEIEDELRLAREAA
jgi:hypothetical protein